jgi:hypothetical protein
LERQGADIQTKVEELEQLNQAMRDGDKVKDDAIAHLSDQLIALTARLDSNRILLLQESSRTYPVHDFKQLSHRIMLVIFWG